MDNLTHSLTGLALARAGLNRFCPRAALLMILAANAPDIDAVAFLHSQLRQFELHRGYSHSLIGLPVVALLPVLLTAATTRWRLPWLNAWLLSCIGVASHILIDLTNDYGVRLFLPFSSRWYYLDLNGLWDVAILAVLLFAAVWPWFVGLVSGEIGDRKTKSNGVAIFALCFFLLYDCGRAILHNQVLEQLQSRVFDGQTPRRIAALPQHINPFRWRGVVETDTGFREFDMTAFGDFNPDSGRIFYKPQITPSLANALKTEAFRYFLYFARFPLFSEEPAANDGNEAKRVEVTDLRFGSLAAIATEDAHNQVIRSWFSYTSDRSK